MAAGWSTEETRTFLGIWGAADVQVQLDGIVRNQAIYEKIAIYTAHDMTRLWLLGTPRRDRLRLRVQVQTQSKSIECSFNVHSIVLRQCRFNVVYSANTP